MEINEFWYLIERVKSSSGIDIDKRSVILAQELKKLKPSEIVSFSKIFSDLLAQAYSWELWGAAYTIQGGCGDDGFWDFRSSLISVGKAPFSLALTNPDSLADLDENEIDNLYFEGFQYVAGKIYEELTGKEIPSPQDPHPSKPTGKNWDFDDEEITKSKLPRLFSKFW